MSTAIGFRFLAGRYHATPWQTHVNEAEVEWPPSCWRFLRALVAVWHLKMDPEQFPEQALEDLIEILAADPPYYRLPVAVHAHTRHYMPERSGRSERRVLVFDAFARIDPDDELVMIWPEVELASESRKRIAQLLNALAYLGRAESWVDARVLDQWDGIFDCAPSQEADAARARMDSETIRLPVPVTPNAYGQWRDEKVTELGLDTKRLNKGQRKLLATLPEGLLGTLRLESREVRQQGWSRPPGMKYVLYRRPPFTVQRVRGTAGKLRRKERKITTARLILSGKPLPRLEDAVRIGELVRFAATRKADDATEKGDIPPVLTGHGLEDANHQHAFYLPEDQDGDGHLNHVIVHADAGLDVNSLGALDRIRRLWWDEGNEWRVTLEGYGPAEAFGGHRYIGPSRAWKSVTPYLHPWYRKKRFGPQDQIRREFRMRSFPAPVIERLSTILVRGRQLRSLNFHRFRRKRGLRQPDTRGSFWRLTFAEPVQGPLALGFGCHFGLGLFEVDERD